VASSGRTCARPFRPSFGTVTVSPDPAACSVDVSIDVATISTQVSQRDDDLRSEAYFDVKKFLTMTYQGRGIHRVSADLWRMDGSLTLHGITKVVPLTFKYNGVFANANPNQPARVAFHGTAARSALNSAWGRETMRRKSLIQRHPMSISRLTLKQTQTLLLPNVRYANNLTGAKRRACQPPGERSGS